MFGGAGLPLVIYTPVLDSSLLAFYIVKFSSCLSTPLWLVSPDCAGPKAHSSCSGQPVSPQYIAVGLRRVWGSILGYARNPASANARRACQGPASGLGPPWPRSVAGRSGRRTLLNSVRCQGQRKWGISSASRPPCQQDHHAPVPPRYFCPVSVLRACRPCPVPLVHPRARWRSSAARTGCRHLTTTQTVVPSSVRLHLRS